MFHEQKVIQKLKSIWQNTILKLLPEGHLARYYNGSFLNKNKENME